MAWPESPRRCDGVRSFGILRCLVLPRRLGTGPIGVRAAPGEALPELARRVDDLLANMAHGPQLAGAGAHGGRIAEPEVPRSRGSAGGRSGDRKSPKSPEERTFSSLDEFNAAANAPAPNTTYTFGSLSWTTDKLRRTVRVTGRAALNKVGRNDALQRQIGKEGKDGDVGFHLVADSLGGPTNRLDVVPGNGKRLGDGPPNLNQGKYKKVRERDPETAGAAPSRRGRYSTTVPTRQCHHATRFLHHEV